MESEQGGETVRQSWCDSDARPHYDTEIPAGVRQAWIDGIGRSDGPVVADRSAVSLDGVDLSPLRQNARLRTLDLTNSGTDLQQWQAMATANWRPSLTPPQGRG